MDKAALLRRMWRQMIHTDPGATAYSSSWRSIWEPSERLLAHLGRLPAGLLAFWLQSGRGHIVIGAAPSAYAPGEQAWRERRYEGLCTLNSTDVATGATAMWHALFACCDHLLGSGGAPGGANFSTGVGVTPRLQVAAQRFQVAVQLGYAAELLSASEPQAYLCGAWQLYLDDPARLNIVDPQTYRLLHDSLMSDAFWSLVMQEYAQTG